MKKRFGVLATIVAALALCLCLTGCGSNNSIQGKWHNIANDHTYEFKSDNSFTLDGSPQGSWKDFRVQSAKVGSEDYNLYQVDWDWDVRITESYWAVSGNKAYYILSLGDFDRFLSSGTLPAQGAWQLERV